MRVSKKTLADKADCFRKFQQEIDDQGKNWIETGCLKLVQHITWKVAAKKIL